MRHFTPTEQALVREELLHQAIRTLGPKGQRIDLAIQWIKRGRPLEELFVRALESARAAEARHGAAPVEAT